jgi:excisionase family DNA binding protein
MDARAPLSADQVAQLLLCSPDTVRELARSGQLPGIKLGRDWVFPAGALFARLDALALAQAEERRTPIKPSATLHDIPAARHQATPHGGRSGRRQPPALPSLGA